MIETPSHDDDEVVGGADTPEGTVAPLGNVQEVETVPTRTELVAALKEIDPQIGPTAEHREMVGRWIDVRLAQADADNDKEGSRVKAWVDIAILYSEAGGHSSAKNAFYDALQLAQGVDRSASLGRSDLIELVLTKRAELGYRPQSDPNNFI